MTANKLVHNQGKFLGLDFCFINLDWILSHDCSEYSAVWFSNLDRNILSSSFIYLATLHSDLIQLNNHTLQHIPCFD